MQKITDAAGAAGDSFGFSVSISGNTAIVGAYLDNVGANADQGSVSIYQYNGSNWIFVQKITDDTGIANSQFGWQVSISENYAIAGAPYDGGGSANIYRYNGISWVLMQKLTASATEANFGYMLSLTDNYAAIYSGPGINVYRSNGVNWVFMQKLTDATLSNFGSCVAVAGDYIIAGNAGSDVNGYIDNGSIDIFFKVNNNWSKWQFITDPMGTASNLFGSAVAIDAVTKRFLIGAKGFEAYTGKAVFGKIN